MRYWITHGTSAVLRSPVIMVSVSVRSEEHTSELQSQSNLVCRLLLEKKKNGSDNSSMLILGDGVAVRDGHGGTICMDMHVLRASPGVDALLWHARQQHHDERRRLGRC